MERILDMNSKNEKIIEGETFEYNGEVCEVPPMTEDEIAVMKEEGNKIGNITIILHGQEIRLIDMKDGRKLYKRIQAMKIEGNINSFWYTWREARIEEGLANLPEPKRAAIKKLLGRK